MPSNETAAFDMLNASEYDLWEWAVKRAGAENAATYIRDETLKALQKPGTPEMGRADLARAELKGAHDALTRYADSLGPAINARDVAERMSVLAFRDREYPAPKPAECRLSDGRVVEWNEWETPLPHRTIDIVTNKGRAGCESRRCFKSLEDMRTMAALPYADWQLIDKAFAATHAEGTDGR